jgi:hypothetical protein
MLGIVVAHGRLLPAGKNTVNGLSRQQSAQAGDFLFSGAAFTMV